MKFAEAGNNFTKFVKLAINFGKACKTRKNFMKFVDWKFAFKWLKVFSLFKPQSTKHFNW